MGSAKEIEHPGVITSIDSFKFRIKTSLNKKKNVMINSKCTFQNFKFPAFPFLFFIITLFFIPVSCRYNQKEKNTLINDNIDNEKNITLNKLSKEETEKGWELLWNGKTTAGWRSIKGKSFPDSGWVIHNGILIVEESGSGGSIITVKKYSDFELKIEVKLTDRANSGIKYFVMEELSSPGFGIGLEYQILDDEKHPDANKGIHPGSRTFASLYDLIAPTNKTTSPVGQWNTVQIISYGTQIEHWLNGKKVLEYERGSKQFRKLVQTSKYKNIPGFGEAPDGYILLQDHGNQVSFRNIKIRVNKPE